MKKMTQLPVPFVFWYWDYFCDGYECPSYMVYDQQSEYGCNKSEYTNYCGDIIHAEVKEWMIEHLSNEKIIELLNKWEEDLTASYERYIEYYFQTKKEIELIKIEI